MISWPGLCNVRSWQGRPKWPWAGDYQKANSLGILDVNNTTALLERKKNKHIKYKVSPCGVGKPCTDRIWARPASSSLAMPGVGLCCHAYRHMHAVRSLSKWYHLKRCLPSFMMSCVWAVFFLVFFSFTLFEPPPQVQKKDRQNNYELLNYIECMILNAMCLKPFHSHTLQIAYILYHVHMYMYVPHSSWAATSRLHV